MGKLVSLQQFLEKSRPAQIGVADRQIIQLAGPGLRNHAAILQHIPHHPVFPDLIAVKITLTGRVLAIGGLKEKVLAAHRAGVCTIIAPERNRDDLDDIPDNVRNDLQFIFVSEAAQALAAAL